MKWISVEERLPDQNGKYLIHILPTGANWPPSPENYFLAFFIDGDWHGNFDKGFSKYINGNCTHWMHMPSPPEITEEC